MTGHNDASDAVKSLTENQRHELLANQIRRGALAELATATAPVGVGELAEGVVTRIEDQRTCDVSSVKVELHHQHLPNLELYGLLQYDFSNQAIVANHVTQGVFEPKDDR